MTLESTTACDHRCAQPMNLHPPTRTNKTHVHKGIRTKQYTQIEITILSLARNRLHTHPKMHMNSNWNQANQTHTHTHHCEHTPYAPKFFFPMAAFRNGKKRINPPSTFTSVCGFSFMLRRICAVRCPHWSSLTHKYTCRLLHTRAKST